MHPRTTPSRSCLSRAALDTSLVAALALIVGCAATPTADSRGGLPVVPDVEVTRAPYERVFVEFKETLGQGYVYVERRGPYNDVREGVQALLDGTAPRGIEPSGPLFVQFFQDAGEDSQAQRSYRVGMPVAEPVPGDDNIEYATAPPETVVYAVVSGPFGSGRFAYTGLREFMAQWGWVQQGPIKEIYGFPSSPDGEFLTEVQIPWAPGS